jgi:DNA polymerase I
MCERRYDEEALVAILLIDGYNLMYRSFTSLPRSIVGADKKPINGVYGLLTFLNLSIRQFGTDRVTFAFDTPGFSTFRHDLYPDYQGQRGPLGGEHADDFARQTVILQQVVTGLGIPVVARERFEADDLIGSLAVALAAEGEQAIIVSTDRDLLQLIRPGIEMYSPSNPPLHARSEDDVRARLGVSPAGVTTFKALAGDASDNIPGVPGIGAKSASSLVAQYGTLENMYEHLHEMPPRLSTKLSEGRAEAFLFRQVVTVLTDLEVPVDEVREARAKMAPDDTSRQILNRFGFG